MQSIHQPTPESTKAARAALKELSALSDNTRQSPMTVSLRATEGGEEIVVTLPADAVGLLVEILAQMAKGSAVSVVPTDAELTTQQAADMLGVSRPYLVGLLESGQIPFHKVGTHRRVKMEALLAHKARDDAERKQVADELAAEAQALGLCD